MNRGRACTSGFRVIRRLSAPAGLSLLLLSAACGKSEPPAPATPAPPPVKTPEERASGYIECWKQFNEKNFDAFQNCYAEQATSETVDSADPVRRGRAAIIDFDKKEITAFPDRQGEVLLALVNGPHVASIAIWTATNHGDLPPGPDGKPVPATHKPVGLYLAHTGELDATGSQIVSDAVYLDETTSASQLGLIKAPTRPVLKPMGAAPVIVIAKNDDTEAKNLAAFRATIDSINKHDQKAFADSLADDYKLIDVTMPADLNKKQALAGMADYMKGFPDLAMAAPKLWAAGEYVVAEGTFKGTNTGPIAGMGLKKPTGKTATVRFFEVLKYENGKVKEDWTIFNSAAFASQLGLK